MVIWKEEDVRIESGFWKNDEHVLVMFDHTDRHRYRLSVTWETGKPEWLFVMLNPSTADAGKPDATLYQCMNIAKRQGYGSLEVVNLYSLRTKSPQVLFASDERHHSPNDGYLADAIGSARQVIVAWGQHGGRDGRDQAVLNRIREAGKTPYCLGTTKSGMPRHPLYLRSDTPLVEYRH
ncbi:hypothetical protein C772_01542 [Bhargavaea cecembensis DSE10]|uniref:DUF1643 domain-containing protein n=1 Tax=Bhargavaea cecembensis DSE10 TaxID=1235279 RepID=M7NHC8_9BACL|nr:DUF1643 domain-containing protein [Bhargavaea cecembensis]EMR06647.1 hypothetical protein C772_01542 [Bhargavaea cecembensis DSE10]